MILFKNQIMIISELIFQSDVIVIVLFVLAIEI